MATYTRSTVISAGINFQVNAGNISAGSLAFSTAANEYAHFQVYYGNASGAASTPWIATSNGAKGVTSNDLLYFQSINNLLGVTVSELVLGPNQNLYVGRVETGSVGYLFKVVGYKIINT